jgi:hypothetical protein
LTYFPDQMRLFQQWKFCRCHRIYLPTSHVLVAWSVEPVWISILEAWLLFCVSPLWSQRW